MTDYKALCAELLDEIPHESPLTCMARAALAQPEPERAINWPAYFVRQAAVQEQELKAALAEPEPEGPTDDELRQIFDDQSGFINDEQVMWWSDFRSAARAVLARWGNL